MKMYSMKRHNIFNAVKEAKGQGFDFSVSTVFFLRLNLYLEFLYLPLVVTDYSCSKADNQSDLFRSLISLKLTLPAELEFKAEKRPSYMHHESTFVFPTE